MIPNLEETYCLIDNLTSLIDKKANISKVGRKKKLARSELLTIAIIKQKLGIKTNKQLYFLIKEYIKKDFPNMPSYQQFCYGLESNFWHLGIINLALLELNKQKFSEFFVIRPLLKLNLCFQKMRNCLFDEIVLVSFDKLRTSVSRSERSL